MESVPYLPFVLAVLAVVGYAVASIVLRRPNASRLNVTNDWTPVPQEGQEPAPFGTPLSGWFRGAITRHLESGESLEGLAHGFFSPPGPRDWGVKMWQDKHPLLIAVTSRRILLFELGYRTVLRSCFIGYGDVQFMIPPKPGFLGTSGKLRFGLTSGREYQCAFLGPLFSDEGMRQEQALADYLRSIASRFPSSPPADSLAA